MQKVVCHEVRCCCTSLLRLAHPSLALVIERNYLSILIISARPTYAKKVIGPGATTASAICAPFAHCYTHYRILAERRHHLQHIMSTIKRRKLDADTASNASGGGGGRNSGSGNNAASTASGRRGGGGPGSRGGHSAATASRAAAAASAVNPASSGISGPASLAGGHMPSAQPYVPVVSADLTCRSGMSQEWGLIYSLADMSTMLLTAPTISPANLSTLEIRPPLRPRPSGTIDGGSSNLSNASSSTPAETRRLVHGSSSARAHINC